MADLEARPFPPGEYPVVVVGSGPGGLQTSYCLSRLGIRNAVLSQDEGPGGMFRKFPLFDRLISWTKVDSPALRGTREFERYDWNSLLVDDPSEWVGVTEFMDGTTQFPSREEMAQGMAAFAERNRVEVQYGCRWEGTAREKDGFVIHTSDGEYRCRVAVFATGVTEPWKPPVPGIELVPHYMEVKPPENYWGRTLYILGKGASAFEIADGLIHAAHGIVLSSPSEVSPSVISRSLAGVRARYMQPMEDHVFGGRTVTILDAATERIERTDRGYRLALTGTTRPWTLELEVDEVIAATGVSAPLKDLAELGVETFGRVGRLPALTPFWESATAPGIFFAGSISQAAFGIRKNSGTGAVHGFRYSARILARHIAERFFGATPSRTAIRAQDLTRFLLQEATFAPELWHQRIYLARAVILEGGEIRDEGIVPLTHFVDTLSPDGVAVAVTFDEEGQTRPAIYVRRGGEVEEHFMEPNSMLDYTTSEHERELQALLKPLFGRHHIPG